MAIFSNRSWICLLKNETIDSEKIIKFLNHLAKWLSRFIWFWSIQNSLKVTQILAKLNWNIVYLPVYSPMYTPIENWFGILKFFIKQNYKWEAIKINLKQNYTKIYEALKSISFGIVKAIFRNLFARIRNYLDNLILCKNTLNKIVFSIWFSVFCSSIVSFVDLLFSV